MTVTTDTTSSKTASTQEVKYPGIRITTNGNQLVALYTQARICDAGVYYPITASTEMGEMFELSYAKGELNVFGEAKIAIETEGEHAAMGGAIAISLTGKRVCNFTSGQGIVYGLEQYYHAPPKFSTMVLEVAARALTKHSLNVHCGHDDVYAAIDTGWIILFGKDAQQAADQSIILRKVTEKVLNPGMNCQDGFLTSHLERTFQMAESELIREYLGRSDDMIDTPTEAQKALFGPKRKRVPEVVNLKTPYLVGSVQNQDHYMQGIASRRKYFVEPILEILEEAFEEYGQLTGRKYGFISKYKTDDADTVFVAMGSAVENIEAAVDHLRDTRDAKVGVIHINVVRPFPEAAVINALRGKKNVIILERTDEPMSSDNPLARDIRTALNKGIANSKTNAYARLPSMELTEQPRIFSGVYGLGSRDFRPENTIGAYEYVTGEIAREDGKKATDGESFIYLGVKHPYAVISKERPSLLPVGAIAVRFHSIGGWGAITTGKNLAEIFGQLGGFIGKRQIANGKEDDGQEILHVSANPKYGSEKKGSPTNYFLVVAPERIRVNCDLQHVNVVICCDPKAFTHTNPLLGLSEGGALIWENRETDPALSWQQIPKYCRKQIIEKKIRVFTLSGFEIARGATNREDLQYRMQGNAFLGAFFKVSTFLSEYNIPDEEFLSMVEKQYQKKFGKLGDAVVASNMTVMKNGFSQVKELPHGEEEATDISSMRGDVIKALGDKKPVRFEIPTGCNSTSFNNIASKSSYDSEFRSGHGYDQPATELMATGIMAAATGAEMSKYVARQLKPIYNPDNCTQCMACITACPDTALPNTAQDVPTVLKTMFQNYVASDSIRSGLIEAIPALEKDIRAEMAEEIKKKNEAKPFTVIAWKHIEAFSRKAFTNGSADDLDGALQAMEKIIHKLPFGYVKVNAIHSMVERKNPGQGGLFSIFVSDLCKGCGECVTECGDHEALKMVEETPDINADHLTGMNFLDQLPRTPKKYLGLFNPETPKDSKAAVLQNHLMIREYYDALVSGDGACAGCGEKSILRGITTLTEALMRPLFHEKADRLNEKANLLEKEGLSVLETMEKDFPEAYANYKISVLHLIFNMGVEDREETEKKIAENFKGGNKDLIDALVMVLRQDAFNHKHLQSLEGRAFNGMSVMAMAASTGCNTVYGSSHPSNPPSLSLDEFPCFRMDRLSAGLSLRVLSLNMVEVLSFLKD